jgi:outer membrane receptor for ferrienterochelin and colicin
MSVHSRNLWFGCTSLLILVGSAAAQSAPETVVVTASKIGSQSVRSAPVSVQVLSGDELQAKHVADVQNLITTTPYGALEE